MILHTIVSEYDIFSASDSVLPVKYKSITGGIVEYTEADNKKQIVRLHSTDPYMYLNREFEPYAVFK